MSAKKGTLATGGLGGIIIVVLAIIFGPNLFNKSAAPPPGNTAARDSADRAYGDVMRLYESGTSGEMVSITGRVFRMLDDDLDPPRHQRFILELVNGHTVLIAHNIDLAPRVPVAVGAFVDIRGQYEFNEQGGVIHWTHHDPQEWREGGWIEFQGRRYE